MITNDYISTMLQQKNADYDKSIKAAKNRYTEKVARIKKEYKKQIEDLYFYTKENYEELLREGNMSAAFALDISELIKNEYVRSLPISNDVLEKKDDIMKYGKINVDKDVVFITNFNKRIKHFYYHDNIIWHFLLQSMPCISKFNDFFEIRNYVDEEDKKNTLGFIKKNGEWSLDAFLQKKYILKIKSDELFQKKSFSQEHYDKLCERLPFELFLFHLTK